MRMRSIVTWLLLPLAATLMLLIAAPATQAQGCQFVLGFATIQQQIPQIVGSCLTNEVFDAQGNSNQMTTNGMMQWRKADNFTAFTDGFRSWVNGPCGLEMRLNSQRFPWEANPEGLQVVPSACNATVPIVPPIAILPPQPVPIIEFTADTNPIRQGECTRVRWNVENIDRVFFEGQGVTGQGRQTVCPTQDTTYTLEVWLVDGQIVQRRIPIRVNPAPEARIEFWADDFVVTQGSCTTLRWRVENIDSVFLDGQGVAGNDTRRVCPQDDTTYTLQVRLRDGSTVYRQVTVRVATPR